VTPKPATTSGAPLALDCRYFAAGTCRSCTWLDTPRDAQVARKVARAAQAVDADAWLEPVVGPAGAFRNKAKMVVGGTVDHPTLGILSPQAQGVDLQDCPLYPAAMRPVFAALAQFITLARLEPYDVTARKGELKSVLVTASPTGEFMVRWVLRSTEALARIAKHLPWLQAQIPTLAVASVNILPQHMAVLEGPEETVLTARQALPMRVNDVTVELRPQSFFQTNTDVAAQLYAQVTRWLAPLEPRDVWDLYCGVGGFALHLVAPGREVVGVEASEQAIAAARDTVRQWVDEGRPGADHARFVAQDATAFALAATHPPDAVIVNPPRRGIGPELADWVQRSGVPTVVYSSCNVDTLQADLARMSAYRVVEARVLDMFPHTAHMEVAVLLRRA